ncbi:uncharacterized protein LOC136071688 [Hydra vulgaris]|uniref:uncharacterized protein LOC136071688 n=1 Tax=Hydra vulgaris TaxID=6087 RepID=UPI0032EA0A14
MNIEIKQGDEFDNFAEFENKLASWSAFTNILWTKCNSKTVTLANKGLSQNSKHFDEKFKFRNVTYLCKHGGVKRTKGKGIRPNQSSFKIGCCAKLYISINKDKTKLVVQQLQANHNHEVTRTAFMHYPEQRRLREIVKDDIGTMFKLGVKVCLLKEYLKNKERKIVTSKDLFNINKKIELERNCEKDPDTVISV